MRTSVSIFDIEEQDKYCASLGNHERFQQYVCPHRHRQSVCVVRGEGRGQTFLLAGNLPSNAENLARFLGFLPSVCCPN